MRKEEVARGPRGRVIVIVIDSITQLAAGDEHAVVVSGSHGGTSSASFALECPPALVFFNDAGVGKDGAGIAALALLQARGVACATVAHTSARIGDALDAWRHGVVSYANAAAVVLGVRVGDAVQTAAERLLR